MKHLCASALVVAGLAFPLQAAAYSGFSREAGSAYVKLAYTNFASADFYDQLGNLNSRGQSFSQQTLNVYGEVGIYRGLSLSVSFPALVANAFANTNTTTGVGDLLVELKYGLELGGFRLALSVGPELPIGDSDATVQTDSGLNVGLPRGDGELNVWTKLAASRPFTLSDSQRLYGWASVGVGYNLRTSNAQLDAASGGQDDFSDQVGFGAEVGVSGWGWVTALVRLRGLITPTPFEDLAPLGGFIFGEGTEYISLGIGLAVQVPRTPVSVTYDWQKPVALERNIYSGSLHAVGVSLDI